MDFEKDIADTARALLDGYGISHKDLVADRDVVHRWLNVELRLIPPRQRQVQYSEEFKSSLWRSHYLQVLRDIEHAFANARDVNKYLSKKVFEKDFPDQLFYDWGIHHLHLGGDDPNGYFVRRTNHLLFLAIEESNVMFIDIRPHDETLVFAQKALLDIMASNWPAYMERFRIEALDVEHLVDNPENIHELRKAGMSVVHKIAGRIYMPPGGGLTTAGTGVAVTLSGNALYSRARHLARWVESKREFLASKLMIHPSQLDLKFVPFEDGWDLYERTTGTRIRTGT